MQEQPRRVHGAQLGASPRNATSLRETSARLTQAPCTSQKEASVAAVPVALAMSVRRLTHMLEPALSRQEGRRVGVRFQAVTEIVVFINASIPAVGPHQPLVQCIEGVLTERVERPEREPEH